MNLFPALNKAYCEEKLTALEAQRMAEFIAWGPIVFQVSRLMVKFGIFELLGNSKEGLTREKVCKETGLSDYVVKCLLEASLCIGSVLIDTESDHYQLSKVGWFLLNDPATRVNIDFNHDVNYRGWYRLEESLLNGKPEGLKEFGEWNTVYEGLSSLPPQVQKSWFAFDHFYSDSAFPDALRVIFDGNEVRSLYDIGGNTGKWALQCVDYDEDVKVTVLDLPQQIEMMRHNVAGKKGSKRISGYGINLLNEEAQLPIREDGVDAIWMSQFLDCFSMEEITSILKRVRAVMTERTRVYVMETLWDRQRFAPAAFCLTMTSLYFTAIANGNSKMYNTEDLEHCIALAGLEIEKIHDHLGQGHSILVIKKKN